MRYFFRFRILFVLNCICFVQLGATICFFNSVNFAISMRFTNYFAQAAFLHKVLILEIDFEKRALPPEYQSIFFSARSSVSSYIVRPLRFCNLNLKKYFCTFRIIKANISVLSFSPQGSDSPCVNPYLYFFVCLSVKLLYQSSGNLPDHQYYTPPDLEFGSQSLFFASLSDSIILVFMFE